MKVYVVTTEVMYEGGSLGGIYATREAAEKHLKVLLAANDDPSYVFHAVEEWDVLDAYEPD